jgi:hypothetical protein
MRQTQKVGIPNAYRHYRGKKKEEGKEYVSESVFKKVCYSFNKKLIDRVLDGFHTQLPYHMGFIRVVGRKAKVDNMSVDFKATKEHGQVMYHDNRHTDGHYFFWDWQKPNHLVRNLIHYTFKPARGNRGTSPKEKLGKILKAPNGYKRYMILK